MLRVGQKELVETYRKGYCGEPAIPGGGKTFALTQWAVEILTEGINSPGKILIVTYMTSAANNFKQRIGLELEKRGISSRDYYSIQFNGLDVGKYHTYFDSRYQNFNFTSNCLTIKGTALNKVFQTFKIKIYI